MKIGIYKAGAEMLKLQGKALQASDVWGAWSTYSASFKDVNGTARTTIVYGYNKYNASSLRDSLPTMFNYVANILSFYKNLKAYASTDNEDDYEQTMADSTSSKQYSVSGNDIIGTTQSSSVSGSYDITYTITVTNTSAETKTIKSVKFTNTIGIHAQYYTIDQTVEGLVMAAFLESPITINAGATESITIKFSFLPSVSQE